MAEHDEEHGADTDTEPPEVAVECKEDLESTKPKESLEALAVSRANYHGVHEYTFEIPVESPVHVEVNGHEATDCFWPRYTDGTRNKEMADERTMET